MCAEDRKHARLTLEQLRALLRLSTHSTNISCHQLHLAAAETGGRRAARLGGASSKFGWLARRRISSNRVCFIISVTTEHTERFDLTLALQHFGQIVIYSTQLNCIKCIFDNFSKPYECVHQFFALITSYSHHLKEAVSDRFR